MNLISINIQITQKQIKIMNTNSANAVVVANVRTAMNKKGESFTALDLEQLIAKKSATSGKEYLAVRKASVTSALSPAVAQSLIGKTLPGQIIVAPLEEADYREWTNPTTKEKVIIKTQNVWVSE